MLVLLFLLYYFLKLLCSSPSTPLPRWLFLFVCWSVAHSCFVGCKAAGSCCSSWKKGCDLTWLGKKKASNMQMSCRESFFFFFFFYLRLSVKEKCHPTFYFGGLFIRCVFTSRNQRQRGSGWWMQHINNTSDWRRPLWSRFHHDHFLQTTYFILKMTTLNWKCAFLPKRWSSPKYFPLISVSNSVTKTQRCHRIKVLEFIHPFVFYGFAVRRQCWPLLLCYFQPI